MLPARTEPDRVSFDRFEVDFLSGRLLKNGRRIRLQPQPFRMLGLMLRRPGVLITREEVCRELWDSDTFVEFDHSLGTAVNKIREALGDSAENPKFIETIPRRGYRFIGQIANGTPPAPSPAPSSCGPPVLSISRVPSPINDTVSSERTLPTGESWRRLAVIAAIGLIAVSAGALAYRHAATSTQHAFDSAINVSPFTALPGVQTASAFSPDGSRVAFAWNGDPASGGKGYDLYVKSLGSETLLRLTNHPSDWISPVWSPDGAEIAFHRMAGADTGIYLVSAMGGPERKLRATRIPYADVAPLSWSPDGKWIGFGEDAPGESLDRMFLLSPATLEVQPIPHDPRCVHEAMPTFSHHGDKIAYICVHSLADIEIYVRSPWTAQPTRIGKFEGVAPGLAWTVDDRRILLSHAADEGGELDEFSLEGGAMRRLEFAPIAEWPAISPVGEHLAFSKPTSRINIFRRDLLHIDAPPVELSITTREQENPQYAPDGQRIAFASSRGGHREIWVSAADGTNLLQLSNLHGYTTRPQWSPDGKKIVFGTHQGPISYIFVVDVGEAVPRLLKTSVEDIASPSWSRDGKWIYFRSYEASGHKIYRCPAEGGTAEVVRVGHDGTSPQESPDGSLLYVATRNVNLGLVTVRLSDGNREVPVQGLPAINNESQWLVTKDGIYFVPMDAPNSLSYFDLATKKTRLVFTNPLPLGEGLSLSPDGRWLLYSQIDEQNTGIMLAYPFR
jgi:Tol biopolymer transport system component/DNA-binding winged helix-turn-helix (wHTH) protein